eukprot:gnl/MRDRNA2_/MRDRNA2_89908_c0_seq1.p2 gnl/MRDRNA2_/MRDRNA2_89908_c0~~gnl/MRDRNA2_/MRDRNA2_89908_c0_seq1.p2  ORF type:complete len:258 (+),score=87.99 gnl/MRDRNA2_/MRDRNA2_89908_c0_seq1:93-866(+)
MFPAHAAKTAAAEEKKEKKEPKYTKVPGTEIQHMKGGVVVRVAIKSGMQFQPDDVDAAKKHVAEIKGENAGKEKGQASQKNGGGKMEWPKSWGPMPAWAKQWIAWYGKGGGKGGGSEGKKKKKKVKKELTEEQKEARAAKQKERDAKILAEENRVIASNDMHSGEVIARGNRCGWVKPKNPNRIPKAVMTKLQAMNAEMREKAKEAPKKKQAFEEDVIYVRTADVVTEGLRLTPGTMVKFKLYHDSKGVGGCQVVAE